MCAAHYDHGLQENSEYWMKQCRLWATELDVEWVSDRRVVDAGQGESVEAAARTSRYRWLDEISQAGDFVMTAHHLDDQAETFLMSLLQGKGLAQLAGIVASRAIVRGSSTRLIRPLLGFSRTQLVDYASRHQLQWIEDPSNKDTRFYRNFLRQKLIPALAERNPDINNQMFCAAENCRIISDKLTQEGGEILLDISSKDKKSVYCLLDPIQLGRGEYRDRLIFSTLLRTWLHQGGYRSPSDDKLTDLANQIKHSHSSRISIRTDILCLRYFNGFLYATPILTAKPPENQCWDFEPGTFAEILLQVSANPMRANQLKGQPTLSWRKGGERMRLPGRDHYSALKKLYQEYKIPPWERENLPLLQLHEEVIWVHGIGAAHDFENSGKDEQYFPEFSMLAD